MAIPIPNTLVRVTGFLSIINEIPMTNIRLDALATAYVSGVTRDRTLKAIIFCSQFRTPSQNSRITIL